MRAKIIEILFEKMKEDDKIFFLTADMGINMVEKFEEHFSNRFLNVGIAEQNLIGISAGLANMGFKPFAYTISNFAITRCLEQIRNDIVIHKYPVTIMGTSTGFDNAPLGPTHHIIDEWGTLRGIPGIDIYCPSSVQYASNILDIVIKNNSPSYIRIPKGQPNIEKSEKDLYFSKGTEDEKILISYGTIGMNCLEVQKIDNKINVLLLNKLHPLNSYEILNYINKFKKIWIVEDHFPQNGIFNSICEIIAKNMIVKDIKSIAPSDYTLKVGNSPNYFWSKYSLDIEGIISLIA